MPGRYSRCRSIRVTATTRLASPASCRPAEVRVKDLDSHSVRALLASRALLVKIKRDLENQIRQLLKNIGLVISRAKFNVLNIRAEELNADRPELIAVVGPLLKARKAIEQQTDDLVPERPLWRSVRLLPSLRPENQLADHR